MIKREKIALFCVIEKYHYFVL